MFKRLSQNRPALLALGVVIGFVIGLNVSGFWPRMPLHAVATHGQENFAIATGFVDEGIEAIYFLDFLTGDMKAAVINTRNGPTAGKFNAFYTYNILSDFAGPGPPVAPGDGGAPAPAAVKNAKYLMVTGEANLPRGRANFQFANSIVYVAEATTGQVACYTIPWNSAAHAAGRTQNANFVLLDKKPFRTAVIRDQ